MKAFLALALCAVLAACTTSSGTTSTTASTPCDVQCFDKAYLQASAAIDQATLLSTTLINAGILKGQDADNTITVVTDAQVGLKLARTFVDPQAGFTKLSITTAALAATTAYLTYLATKQGVTVPASAPSK